MLCGWRNIGLAAFSRCFSLFACKKSCWYGFEMHQWPSILLQLYVILQSHEKFEDMCPKRAVECYWRCLHNISDRLRRHVKLEIPWRKKVLMLRETDKIHRQKCRIEKLAAVLTSNLFKKSRTKQGERAKWERRNKETVHYLYSIIATPVWTFYKSLWPS